MDVSSFSIEIAGTTIGGQVVLAAAAAVVAVVVGLVVARSARRRRAAAAAQAMIVARHDSAVTVFQATAAEWQERRVELRTLLEAAQNGGTDAAPAGLDLQPGERVYFTTRATLEGHDVADEAGILAITSRRIVLEGASTHEWQLDTVSQMRHVGENRTMLKPCETCTWVGLSYDDVTLTRMYLELATSTSGTSRSELLRNIAQGLNDHELRRPIVPTPAAPVEGLGRKARTAAESWHATRLSELDGLRRLVDSAVAMVPTQTAITREVVPSEEMPVAS